MTSLWGVEWLHFSNIKKNICPKVSISSLRQISELIFNLLPTLLKKNKIVIVEQKYKLINRKFPRCVLYKLSHDSKLWTVFSICLYLSESIFNHDTVLYNYSIEFLILLSYLRKFKFLFWHPYFCNIAFVYETNNLEKNA